MPRNLLATGLMGHYHPVCHGEEDDAREWG